MRYREISEAKPRHPLTPEKARDRAAKVKALNDKMTDLRNTCARKLNDQRRKIVEV